MLCQFQCLEWLGLWLALHISQVQLERLVQRIHVVWWPLLVCIVLILGEYEIVYVVEDILHPLISDYPFDGICHCRKQEGGLSGGQRGGPYRGIAGPSIALPGAIDPLDQLEGCGMPPSRLFSQGGFLAQDGGLFL